MITSDFELNCSINDLFEKNAPTRVCCVLNWLYATAPQR
jgi:hypothetical protein